MMDQPVSCFKNSQFILNPNQRNSRRAVTYNYENRCVYHIGDLFAL